MKLHQYLVVAVAAAVSLTANTLVSAQSALRAELHTAAGKTYNLHANDHARLLNKYAKATAQPVPADVIKEHTTGMRASITAARSAFNQVGAVTQGNAKITPQLASVQQRLDKAMKLIDQLEAQSAREAVQSKEVAAQTAAISQELKAVHTQSQQIDQTLNDQSEENNNFYNSDSDSYYETGEGHFVD